MEEQQLITRCRDGDREAQRQVFELAADRVFRLLHRMTGSTDEASDLTQEVFIRVFTHMHQFRGDCSLTTWIHRIAVNLALAAARRARLERKLFTQLREDSSENGTAKSEARLDLQEALGRLEEEDRAILLLRYDERLDYRTIAEALHCPMGTVASRLNRARGQLKHLLDPGYGRREENLCVKHQTHGNGARLFLDKRAATVERDSAFHCPTSDDAKLGGRRP